MIVSRPANHDGFFTVLIVKAPIIPTLSFILAACIIAFEYPVPWVKGKSIHRSFIVRVIALLAQAVMAIVWYQVRRIASI